MLRKIMPIKELTIEDYPFYQLRIPSDKESLIKGMRKMAIYWEKLSNRNADMSLERLNSETVPQLKSLFKTNVSKEMAEIWLKWKLKKNEA